MYKLICVEEKEVFEKLQYINSWENNNFLPTPYKKITKNEFEKLFFTYSFNFIEHRQGYVGKSKKWHNIEIYYNSHIAIAIVYNYINSEKYAKTYYKIGCEHDWKLKTQDSIDYTYVCSKCGVTKITPTGR